MKESLAVQKALMENMPKRFISWLLDNKIEKISSINDELINQFVEFNKKEIISVGSQAVISFGKRYKGCSYFSVWNGGRKGRSYLLWCLQQKWFYNDNREIIKGLIEQHKYPDVPEDVDCFPQFEESDNDNNDDDDDDDDDEDDGDEKGEGEDTLPDLPPQLSRQRAYTSKNINNSNKNKNKNTGSAQKNNNKRKSSSRSSNGSTKRSRTVKKNSPKK